MKGWTTYLNPLFPSAVHIFMSQKWNQPKLGRVQVGFWIFAWYTEATAKITNTGLHKAWQRTRNKAMSSLHKTRRSEEPPGRHRRDFDSCWHTIVQCVLKGGMEMLNYPTSTSPRRVSLKQGLKSDVNLSVESCWFAYILRKQYSRTFFFSK